MKRPSPKAWISAVAAVGIGMVTVPVTGGSLMEYAPEVVGAGVAIFLYVWLTQSPNTDE